MIAPETIREYQRDRLLRYLGRKMSCVVESEEAREDRLDERYREIWNDEPIAFTATEKREVRDR